MPEVSTFRLYLLRGLYLLIAVGLPLWRGGRLTAATGDTLRDCLVGLVLVCLAVPWDYVLWHYVRAGGVRWRGAASGVR